MGPHGEQVLPAGDQRAWLHEAQLGARLSGNHEDVEVTCGRLRSQTEDSFWQRLMPILLLLRLDLLLRRFFFLNKSVLATAHDVTTVAQWR